MAETLSQSQIDELLQRMHSGEVDVDAKPKIKEYDFKSPKKFTKEQLKALDGLHENFSRVLSSYFTSILRGVCDITVLQIEEQRYYEYNNALPDNTLIGILDFKPEDKKYDETSFVMDISTSFGYLIIDRLLGGSGKEIYTPQRDYTEIELAILNGVLEKMTEYLQDAWCNYLPVETKLQSVETNARLLQAFPPQDIVVIVALKVEMDGFEGSISICLPAENLEEVIDSFKTRYSRSGKHQTPERENEEKELILDSLKKSDLEIKAVLDEFRMSLGTIMQLQAHDVIALNKKIDSDILVTVDGVPWYRAKLGESKLKKSIKLVDIMTE